MRVIVVGSSDRVDADVIRDELSTLPLGATIVIGTIADVETTIERVAKELKFDLEEWEVDTERDGPRAETIRNQEMVNDGADLCVAFPTASCKSTWDCIKRARGAQIDTVVVKQ